MKEKTSEKAAQACWRNDDMDALIDWLRGSMKYVPESRQRQLEEKRPGLLERFILGDILGATEYEGMQGENDADFDSPRQVSVIRKSKKRLSDY